MIYAWMFNADCFVFKCREMLKVNRSVNLPICPNNLVLVSVYMYNQMSLTSSRLKTRSLSAIKKQQHRQGTQLKGEGRKTQKNTAAKLPRTIGSSSTVGWQINRAVKPNRVYCCCHCCFGSCQTDTLLIKPDFENWTGCLWLWLKKKVSWSLTSSLRGSQRHEKVIQTEQGRGWVSGGVLLQIPIRHEIRSRKSCLSNRSINLMAYQMPKHCSVFIIL